jgi:hypothetical protein
MLLASGACYIELKKLPDKILRSVASSRHSSRLVVDLGQGENSGRV